MDDHDYNNEEIDEYNKNMKQYVDNILNLHIINDLINIIKEYSIMPKKLDFMHHCEGKGGLLQLVAYGAQDVYLTGNPQTSFFKVVYNRHTNFDCEDIEYSKSSKINIKKFDKHDKQSNRQYKRSNNRKR